MEKEKEAKEMRHQKFAKADKDADEHIRMMEELLGKAQNENGEADWQEGSGTVSQQSNED